MMPFLKMHCVTAEWVKHKYSMKPWKMKALRAPVRADTHLLCHHSLDVKRIKKNLFSMVILSHWIFKNFFYSYVHTMFAMFLSAPSLSPPTPCFQAETVLPLSLILLKREYKQ
jgi:hypothetical protein